MELNIGSAQSTQIAVLLALFHNGAVLAFGSYLSGKRAGFHFLLPFFFHFLPALLPLCFRCGPFLRHAFLYRRFIIHIFLREEIEHFRFIPFLLPGCLRMTVRLAFHGFDFRILFIRIGLKQVEHGFIRFGKNGLFSFCHDCIFRFINYKFRFCECRRDRLFRR